MEVSERSQAGVDIRAARIVARLFDRERLIIGQPVDAPVLSGDANRRCLGARVCKSRDAHVLEAAQPAERVDALRGGLTAELARELLRDGIVRKTVGVLLRFEPDRVVAVSVHFPLLSLVASVPTRRSAEAKSSRRLARLFG